MTPVNSRRSHPLWRCRNRPAPPPFSGPARSGSSRSGARFRLPWCSDRRRTPRRGKRPSWSPPPLRCRQRGLARQDLHLLVALFGVSQGWSLSAATGATRCSSRQAERLLVQLRCKRQLRQHGADCGHVGGRPLNRRGAPAGRAPVPQHVRCEPANPGMSRWRLFPTFSSTKAWRTRHEPRPAKPVPLRRSHPRGSGAVNKADVCIRPLASSSRSMAHMG